ncbi:MAG: glycosyltransferase family 39 protein [Rhodobacteraceae bacterium]|nr:glycosyltransferase family 39 protein [Paracoccaceae bacterium]
MPNAAAPKADGWFRPTLAVVLAITTARVIGLAFNRTDLFVDEAQYWLWGQDLALGYYSKPPMIGWVIRAFTEIGSDAPFWIRLPGPLFHAATAMILGLAAARLFGRRAATLTALAYVTLPMVAVGSLLISTDTVMFPFLAAALALYLALLDRRSPVLALFCGVALGLAFLSKYAAVYYLLCAGLAALTVPGARPGWRAAALTGAAFLVTASPNLIWNLANGLTTVQHTLDNADWVRDPAARAGLNLAGLGAFAAAQFAVFGPVLFVALLAAATGWRGLQARVKLLVLLSLPIIAIVCLQALLANAYANWAAAAYLAGTLVALSWLLRRHRAWLIASFAINGTLCVIFPLATTVADRLQVNDRLLLERYVGRTEMTEAILIRARAEGLTTIVADDRDVLADLFYSARRAPEHIYALAPKGRAPHHYAQRFAFTGSDTDILVVTRSSADAPCADAIELTAIAPASGAYRAHPQTLYRAPGNCQTR